MSSRELFISNPPCTGADASDYVRSLLSATLLVGSVAVQCQSLTSFITRACSKPVVPKVSGEGEMGGWGAIGDPVNNYISVVLLALSDQMA